VAGVAGGLAERLGIDPLVIRMAFVALSMAAGAGVIAYLALWLVANDRPPPEGFRPPEAASPTLQAVAVGLVVLGLLLLLRHVGFWLGDAIAWPIAIAASGSAVIWARTDESGRARLSKLAARLPRGPVDAAGTGGISRLRLLGGGFLVVVGMASLVAANGTLAAIRTALTAMLATGAGLTLILGPWIWRLVGQLSEERRARIRSEERAEVAAHLHDSVLQTLALIQRSSSPEEMATLARGQERELRSWLYGRGRRGDAPGSLLDAVERLAARTEERYRVPVETVVVGDCSLDDRVGATLDAAGEALQNAARHSGASAISLYAEATPEGLSVYVRDEGKGFDPASARDGHRGIADSILGRMERNGGSATLVTEPGQGVEWHLRLPRRPS
jgi:signal transduction histidine kinase